MSRERQAQKKTTTEKDGFGTNAGCQRKESRMIRLALTNPYLVVVTALATLVLGVRIYLFELPADLLPQFETSAVQIVTFYPGMPPEVMERTS